MNQEETEQTIATEDKKQPLKATSFRLSEETTATFKAISNEIGGNPQETLSKLIEVYKLQAGKALTLDEGRKSEMIERVERYTGGILSCFTGLIEEITTLEETLRVQYAEEIKNSKEQYAFLEELSARTDQENQDLKKQVENLTQELETAKVENERLRAEAQNVDLTQALTKALERMGATVPQPTAPDSPSQPQREKPDPDQTTFDEL